jgi:2-polyprenyl-6-methoxyphenol hydroxylase-like FAD-dependent oxidoreductase
MTLAITVVGAGPAGLYFAYLMKKSCPGYVIRVVEQNPPDATYGFGVVLSRRALDFLAQGDAEFIGRLEKNMERWQEQHIVHRGELVAVDVSGYGAIERLSLLHELQSLCYESGVKLEFTRRIDNAAELGDCDVLVAADGANSAVRDAFPDAFDTTIVDLQNYFAWYGVETPYSAHTLTFASQRGNTYCAHHYRYTPVKSTFVAEVDSSTWLSSGMSVMSDDERKGMMEEVFADTLGGRKLISNRSLWRRWRLIMNGTWHHRNIVLVGDALRTAHPSIGSGTRLAMEDSIALWRAFQTAGTDVSSAFKLYEQHRRPVRGNLNKAAEASIAWYESIATRMYLEPYDFAYDYLLRTGVMTSQRLAKESPDFMKRYSELKGRGRDEPRPRADDNTS